MKLPFYEYVDGVIDGKLVVGNYMRLAVERFVKDRDKKDYIFDEKEGTRIISFAEKFCHHWKGPKMGKPILLEPHQHFYWMQKYGWRNPNTGLPRFRRSVKLIARKQYKTTEAAIESLFHMAKGIDQPAQVFTCATKEDDAVVVVNDAGRISQVSPKLKDKFRVSIHEPYVRRVFMNNGSFMTYMTKGHDAVDISFGIGDECHDWPDAGIKNRIESAMGNRIAPMFSTISTAGFNKFGYCFNTLRDTGIKILKGVLEDDEQLIIFFEMDDGDDWKNKELWVKANPNLPYSPTHMPYLESEFKKALNEGGTTEVNFKTKNLNMWTDAPSVFIQDEVWMKNVYGTELKELENVPCYGGLYTASTESLNIFVLYFPKFKGELSAFLCWAWLPEKFIDENGDKMDYRKWVDSGNVTKTPGNSADHKFMSRDVIEICSRYNVMAVGFDKTFGQYVAPELDAEGIPVMEIYQGFNNLGQQTEDLKKMAKGLLIEHFNNPVLRWHLSNTVTHRNSENLEKPDKAASGSRTGAVSAILNAMVTKFETEKEGLSSFTFSSMNK